MRRSVRLALDLPHSLEPCHGAGDCDVRPHYEGHLPAPCQNLRMAHTTRVSPDMIENLARQTDASVELVRVLYEEEVTKLKASATVENYIGVIASQRVKRRLRTRRRAVAKSS